MAINGTEIVNYKITFDRGSLSQVVVINGFNANDCVFNASEFM